MQKQRVGFSHITKPTGGGENTIHKPLHFSNRCKFFCEKNMIEYYYVNLLYQQWYVKIASDTAKMTDRMMMTLRELFESCSVIYKKVTVDNQKEYFSLWPQEGGQDSQVTRPF